MFAIQLQPDCWHKQHALPGDMEAPLPTGPSFLVRGDEEGERVVRTDRTPDGLDLELVLKEVCAVLAMAKLSKRNYAE